MEPDYQDDDVTVYAGDCTAVLRDLPDASVDAVVTDPPYGLEFMGEDWDRPWQNGVGVGGHNAGFSPGAPALPGVRGAVKSLPSYLGSTNPTCRSCGGTRLGNDRASRRACRCDRPDFPNTTLPRMLAYQAWCEEWARECLRVLKPGGHLLAFGGTRTAHRLASAVEDAGFEIRDSIDWIYAQGFPKSLNVEKAAGDAACRCAAVSEHDVPRVLGTDVPASVPARAREGALLLTGVSKSSASADGEQLPDHARGGESSMEGRGDAQAAEGELPRGALRPVPAGVPDHGEDGRLRDGAPASHGAVDRPAVDEDRGRESHRPRPVEQRESEPRPVADERGPQAGRGRAVCQRCGKPRLTGWGTALKPAHEPIVVARKPVAGTVAANVLEHGVGALNIEGCRTAFVSDADERESKDKNRHADFGSGPRDNRVYGTDNRSRGADGNYDAVGRWPTNLLLAHAVDCDSDCVPGCPVVELDRQSGGAARYFPTFRYETKAGADERPAADGTAHPTVKPVALMQWLVRLVVPRGGLVLDPFLGSGTTAEACVVEGMRCIGIERKPEYLPLIRARLRKPITPTLGLDL